MASPTIALCCILKNEIKNLPQMLASVEGCFDEIHLTDTGSTDGSIEWIKEHAESVAKCPVYLHHFKWVNSFAKARNYSFSHATTDYIAWMDLDDCLSNKEAFIQWKKYAMEFAECFFATYHYALDADKKPIISFVRERVFKRALNPEWQFDLHEGIILKPEWSKDYATSWAINHMRTVEDVNADKSRNITILEEMKDKGELPSRLKFYYGKELYEAQQPFKAVYAFEDALKCKDLEPHDKLLAHQYGAYSAFQCAQAMSQEQQQQKLEFLDKAINFAMDGLKQDPARAEFYCTLGDVYLIKGELHKSVAVYGAAQKCINPKELMGAYEGAVYSFIDCYGLVPTLQMAKCLFQMGKIKEAKEEAQKCFEKFKHPEAEAIVKEIERIEGLINLDNNQTQTDDIVITCPPQSAYPFDEEIYKTKPLGGSETALVQMAKYLKEITKRPVKVFNMRDETLIADSGVEYISNKTLNEYMSKNRPHTHIAWRHNIKITNAPTYLWCHDLVTATVESVHNFDKIICLTDFHKNYVMAKQNVPESKIWVSRNGITPAKFKFEPKFKNPNKVVYMSSPDRGLDRCILIMDELIKEKPNLELHVYYGLENLYKYGLGALADKLKAMFAERPWIKYHGFTEQSKMYYDVSDAVMLLHPANFIETFMITALEMLALGVFPVTRRLGALANTLADAELKGQAIMLEHGANNEKEIFEYVEAAKKVLDNKLWENVSLDLDKHDWKQVAQEWVEEMKL